MLLADLSPESVAVIVSVVSLVVAVASLSWQLYEALRVDRPRLRVKVSSLAIYSEGDQPEPVLQVSVVNDGKRPTQLRSLWLGVGKPPRWWHRRLPWLRQREFSVVLYDRRDPYNLGVPCRLDVGEDASVFYSPWMAEQAMGEADTDLVHGAAFASNVEAYSHPVRYAALDRTRRVEARPMERT